MQQRLKICTKLFSVRIVYQNIFLYCKNLLVFSAKTLFFARSPFSAVAKQKIMYLFVESFFKIMRHMLRFIKTAEAIIWERVTILRNASSTNIIYIKNGVQKDPFSITCPHMFTELFLEGKLPFTSLISTLFFSNCSSNICSSGKIFLILEEARFHGLRESMKNLCFILDRGMSVFFI